MIGRRSFLAASLTALAAIGSGCAHADAPILSSPTAVSPSSYQLVSVEVVTEHGSLPAHLYGGSVFLEAHEGARYDLRVTNNSPERVEAVVTVDGRDVVSGELGNYKKQRGYVLQPWETIVIDGYRQSLDHVAAFRFAELPESYTARRGSPEHAGVIGVAVFREKETRKDRKHQPISTRPYYESEADRAAAKDGEPFPEAGRVAHDESAPRGGAFTPAPVPVNELGTAYGETRTSVVYQTRFKRDHKRRPDALLTMYYDSREGLQRRGVLPQYYDHPYDYPYDGPLHPWTPEPFNGFAPPPPGPPAWWD